MRCCVIASGSSGNCIYVGEKDTHILIDAGISCKRIVEGLEAIGVDISSLSGILITHEHSDHIQGAALIARKFGIPIYSGKGTCEYMMNYKGFEKVPHDQFNFVKADEEFYIDNLRIHPFSIHHDAVEPLCYTVSTEEKKFGMVTDTGIYDDNIITKLDSSNALYIEANHDINMLMVGRYPYNLKRRVAGDKGHLSNENSAELIGELLWERLEYIFLAHLSKENNYAELAYETVKQKLNEAWSYGDLPELFVANRDKPSKLVEL